MIVQTVKVLIHWLKMNGSLNVNSLLKYFYIEFSFCNRLWVCRQCSTETNIPNIRYQMKVILNCVNVGHLVKVLLHTDTIKTLLDSIEENIEQKLQHLNLKV